ncbi:hypothetical protein D9M68_567170 [compost metagenome]
MAQLDIHGQVACGNALQAVRRHTGLAPQLAQQAAGDQHAEQHRQQQADDNAADDHREHQVITLVGRIVLALGHLQLHLDQLAEAIGHRIDLLVQHVGDELLQGHLVGTFQYTHQPGGGLVGLLEQGLQLIHQPLLFPNHRGGGVTSPALADVIFGLLYAAQTFLPAERPDPHLVRGIDDVHGIAIGDRLEIL